MADLETHRKLGEQLIAAMRRANAEGHWSITVDAGFYAVFHAMDALNALDCRDSYSFADSIELLERILVPGGLGEAFLKDYEFLLYFRRGVLYGPHFPSSAQLERYVQICEHAYAHALAVLNQQLSAPGHMAGKGGKVHAG